MDNSSDYKSQDSIFVLSTQDTPASENEEPAELLKEHHPTSGTCCICHQGISRRSILEHIKTCKKGYIRQKSDSLSYLLHISPPGDTRYYLILLVRTDVTFYELNEVFMDLLGVTGDPSSRFQFTNQYYFSHMNDGFPGMNYPINSSPVIREAFLYILYAQGWFPILLTGKLMAEVPYASRRERRIEIVAMNDRPEEHHRWPQRPRKIMIMGEPII